MTKNELEKLQSILRQIDNIATVEFYQLLKKSSEIITEHEKLRDLDFILIDALSDIQDKLDESSTK